MGRTTDRLGHTDLRRWLGAAAALLAWLAWTTPAAAQQGTVTGQVTDAETLQPLSEVHVSVADAETGVLTDEEGRYRLQVAAGEVRIRASRIGYRTRTRTVTVSAGETTTLDINLQTSAIALDEIVVTGTAGGQQKRSLGNTVSEIDAAEVVARGGGSDVGNILKARSPGVTVSPATGQVGSGPKIRIRGVSTFSLNDHPLVYVDGVRVDNASSKGISVQAFGSSIQSSLNDLNPQDIESIEVIKGPAAATLYGTEASNGVVQIITKSGSASGGASVSVWASQGANWFRNASGRIPENWGIHPETGEVFQNNLFEQEAALGNDIFKTGRTQEYGLSLRGGSDLLQYYLSGNFDDQEGIEPTNEMTRISGRTNLSVTPHEDWRIDASVGLNKTERMLACEAGCGGVMWAVLYGDPSTINTPRRGFRIAPPRFHWEWREFPQHNEKFTFSLTTDWQTSDWLSHRLVVGQDNVNDKSEQVVERIVDPFILQFITDETARGSKFLQTRDHTTTTFDYSGSVEVPVTETWESNTSVGVQYYSERNEFVTVDARGFPAPGITVTAGAAQTDVGQDDFIENNTLGVYVQEQLVWNDRLYLTGAVRVDDNSAFGDDFDLVTYPKASASWVVSEEPFFDVGWVNQLRLRGAYGQAGQQPAAFAALRTYQPITSGTGQTALTPQSVGNPELAPERGTEIEAGFDASLFDERVGIDFTYYNARTKDAILSRTVPPSAGFPGSQFVNAGEISSNGIEVDLNGRAIDAEDVAVDLGLNLSTTNNEVVDLGGIDQGQGFIASGSIRFVPGLPVASYFDEVTRSAELDADGNAINAMCDAGDPNGITLPDGTPVMPGGPTVPCDEAPVLYQGKTTPDFEGSLTATVTLFQNLRLHGLFDWQLGWIQFDNDTRIRCQIFLMCEENFFPERFDPVRIAEIQSPNTLRTFVYSDASFGKLREISASYDLPQSLIRTLGIGVESASITVSGRNLFPIITDYTSIDPEAEFHDFGFGRLNQNNVPPLANVTASVRVTF
jgi:TonB-linked SusC/RagA family outer membrane protein